MQHPRTKLGVLSLHQLSQRLERLALRPCQRPTESLDCLQTDIEIPNGSQRAQQRFEFGLEALQLRGHMVFEQAQRRIESLPGAAQPAQCFRVGTASYFWLAG